MKKAMLIPVLVCITGSVAFARDAMPDVKVPATAIDSSLIEPPQVPDDVPKDAAEAISTAGGIIEAIKAKNWWIMSASSIWLLMFLLKLTGIFKRIGKRWAYVAVALMSMATMLLSKFGAGVSWEAAMVVMTSGPFMAYANDFVKRGILAKESETPLRKKNE